MSPTLPIRPVAHNPVDEAIVSRRSIRAFLPKPVSRDEVLDLLAVSSCAPSGTNTQPWQVHVLTGLSKDRLCEAILAAARDPAQAASHREEYAYYPTEWRSPYIDRRRKVGWDLYGLLGIAKDNKARMAEQHQRNFTFFDAPVGLIFTIDRVMAMGSWLDYGMFLQNLMVSARGRGLDTCPQAAFTQWHRIIAKHLGLGDEQMLVCGMALGYADPSAIANQLVTEREPAATFTQFYKD